MGSKSQPPYAAQAHFNSRQRDDNIEQLLHGLNDVPPPQIPKFQQAQPNPQMLGTDACDARIKAKSAQMELKQEAKRLDREIKKIVSEQTRSCRKLATLQDVGEALELAVSIVQGRTAVARMNQSKAAIESLNHQIASSEKGLSTRDLVKLQMDGKNKEVEASYAKELWMLTENARHTAARLAEWVSAIDQSRETMEVEAQQVLRQIRA